MVLAMLPFSLCANAQSIFDNLTFEAPKKLVRPTGKDINVRKSGSPKAPKVTKDGYNLTKNPFEILSVEEENTGWYRIKDGWISKTVAKPCKSNPITPEMLNVYYGYSTAYDDYMFWTVAPIKGEHGLYILYRECENFWGEPYGLWLGKKVGNVFVFKYHVKFKTDLSDNENDFKVQKETEYGDVYFKLLGGSKYVLDAVIGGSNFTVPDFSKFNEKVLERIFKESIEKNSTDYYYINSEILSKEYANCIFG